MAVTLNDEVLVASKVSGPQMASNCLKISRLSSSFSGAASMTSALPLAVVEARAGVKTAEDFLFLFGADLAALAAALEKVFDFPQAGVDELLLDVVDESLEAGLGGDLSDPRAHGAGAEDGDFFSWLAIALFVSSLASRFGVRTQDARLETLNIICR